MCSECLAAPVHDGGTGRTFEGETSLPWRHRIAKALCRRHGVHPNSLVANTLDEEPCDGFLPFGTAAHHSWREHLREADGIIAASASASPIGLAGMTGVSFAIRPPMSGHVTPCRAAPRQTADASLPRGEIISLADSRR